MQRHNLMPLEPPKHSDYPVVENAARATALDISQRDAVPRIDKTTTAGDDITGGGGGTTPAVAVAAVLHATTCALLLCGVPSSFYRPGAALFEFHPFPE